MDDKTAVTKPIEFVSVARAAKAAVLLCLGHGVFALATFGKLPERIPIHFNASGQADGFAGAGIGSWFLPWFVSAGLGAVLAWLSLRIDRFPIAYLNMPRKEEFLGLPAPSRSRVMAVISFHLLVLACLLMAFMFSLHVCISLFIDGILDRLPAAFTFGGAAVLICYSIVMTVRISGAVGREIDRHVDR